MKSGVVKESKNGPDFFCFISPKIAVTKSNQWPAKILDLSHEEFVGGSLLDETVSCIPALNSSRNTIL